jgi:hypothetical protein
MKDNRTKTKQILSGWKEIANYLGKGVRTVQRYERVFGLPVRRPAGKPSGSVMATIAEVDAWVAASPIRAEFRLSRETAIPPATWTAIRTNIEEMNRLRAQMRSLRVEMRTSLNLLRTGIHDLAGGGVAIHEVPGDARGGGEKPRKSSIC